MKNYFKKFFGHLRNIILHKFYVFIYCCKFGIPVQGIFHDLSKFSPTEFFESVKYYTGDSSPIDNCKKVNGYSRAWLHHRGRNKHHWEYWVDDFDKGMDYKLMPFKYNLEMICDFIAAGRVYNGKTFSIDNENEWWKANRDKKLMHFVNKALVDFVFAYFSLHKELPTKKRLKTIYEEWVSIQKWKNLGEYYGIILDLCAENSDKK